ncbi:MAG: DUF1186 domain-containing protein [Leptospiraceae bacterium]|nr:DUF1186 domain-containing protein [Leptospiraceae bacterium]
MKKLEILEKLQLPGRQISRKTLLEIQRNPEEFKDDLLEILNREAANPQNPASRDEYNHWLYAIYLLAEFRDKRAYKPIVDLFSRNGNFLNPLTGDVVLQNLGQILSSVANGDSSLIKELIENDSNNEYCRAAGIEALVIMVEVGEISREDLFHYFNDLFKKLERKPIFPWSVLAQSSVLLFKKSFLKEVKQAFNNDLIDEIYIDREEIDAYLANPDLSQLTLVRKKYGIIIDAVDALEWWTNLKEEL